MVQSEAYLITYQEYCCLEGVGAGRKPCSKYVHRVINTATILPST